MTKFKSFIVGLFLGIVGMWIYDLLNPHTETITRTEIKYKTIKETKYINEPKLISVVLPEDTVVIPTDTSALISLYKELHKSYFTRKFYKDTLILDSIGFCLLEQQIIKNSIDSMKYSYSLNIPEKTVYTVVNKKNSLYIGGLVGKDIFAPTLEYNYKNYGFGVGYNFYNNGFLATFKYKIR